MTKISIVLTLALAVLASRLAVELKRLGALPSHQPINYEIMNTNHVPNPICSTNSLTLTQ